MKQETKKVSRTGVNFGLDAAVFVAFLVATAPKFSGEVIHEWLGIALGAAIVTHLLLHWQWIVKTTQRLFKSMPLQQRINHVLNTLLFVDFTLIIFTGLMISEVALPSLGIRLSSGGTWKMLHQSASDVAVYLAGLHVALHWRWIVSTINRYTIGAVMARLRPLPVGVEHAQKEV